MLQRVRISHYDLSGKSDAMVVDFAVYLLTVSLTAIVLDL